MKAAQRYYIVGGNRLILATHPDTAKSFATKDIPVAVATQADIVELMAKGVKPERSRPENAELPLEPAA